MISPLLPSVSESPRACLCQCISFLHHVLLELGFSFFTRWSPAGPAAAFFGLFCLSSHVLDRCVHGVMIACTAQCCLIVNVSRPLANPWSQKKRQSPAATVVTARPNGQGFVQVNSVRISSHIAFLRPPGSASIPHQHCDPWISFKSALSSMHKSPKSTFRLSSVTFFQRLHDLPVLRRSSWRKWVRKR